MRNKSSVGRAGAKGLQARFPHLYGKHRTEVRRVEKCCGGVVMPSTSPADLPALAEEVSTLVGDFASLGAAIDGSSSDEQLGKLARLLKLLDKIGDKGWRIREAAQQAMTAMADELGTSAPEIDEPVEGKSLLRRRRRKARQFSQGATYVEKATEAANDCLAELEALEDYSLENNVADIDTRQLEGVLKSCTISLDNIEQNISDFADSENLDEKSLRRRSVRKGLVKRATSEALHASEQLLNSLEDIDNMSPDEVAKSGDQEEALEELSELDTNLEDTRKIVVRVRQLIADSELTDVGEY